MSQTVPSIIPPGVSSLQTCAHRSPYFSEGHHHPPTRLHKPKPGIQPRFSLLLCCQPLPGVFNSALLNLSHSIPPLHSHFHCLGSPSFSGYSWRLPATRACWFISWPPATILSHLSLAFGVNFLSRSYHLMLKKKSVVASQFTQD